MRYIRSFCFAFLTFIIAVAPAFAAETIKRYDVDMRVNADGSLVVTETLDVQVEGVEFRRGIFRTFPRYLVTDSGRRLDQSYDILSITRDGRKDGYHTRTSGNSRTYYIGKEDVLLDPGLYTYELKYKVPFSIRRQDNTDELYWNAIGSYWNVPIESGTLSVSFPQGANASQVNSYMGGTATRGEAMNYLRGNDGEYVFDVDRTLNPGEGVTLSLSVPKGVINPPSAAEQRYYWMKENGPTSVLSTLLALLAAFYTWAWNKVGRDPVKKAIIPLYEAPKGYSPAAVSHIYYRSVKGYFPLIASLMNLAIKDRIEIDTDKKTTMLTLLSDDAAELPEEEAYLLERVFGHGKTKVTLNKKPNKSFHSAMTKFHQKLGKMFGSDYYKGNAGFGCLGVIISVIAIFWAIAYSDGQVKSWVWGLAAALIAMNFIAFKLIAAPTEKGQRIRTEIEGLRLYLKTAEENVLNSAKVGEMPPITVERYERFLPYAIALDVEKPWTKYFEKSMPVEASDYRIHNTHGNFSSGQGVSNMTKAIVAGVAAGVAAAAPASSSSSGSGGGGSVGGGGGGGGGGGW